MNSDLQELFNVDNFNIYSDNDYYYFFRALNSRDMSGIRNKSILDENGKIKKIITDREYYGATSGYTENSEISLEEVVSHIKMHYDRHTNCISLTSNANTALTYGRGNYEDKYIMVKVPKSEINKKVFPSGLYMLQEINKRIDKLLEDKNIEDYEIQKYFMYAIENCKTVEQLEKVRSILPKKEFVDDSSIYEGGLEFDITDSKKYQTLDKRQNLEKDKVVLKLDVLNKRLLPRLSNKFLTQVIGLGFSSLELTHYKDIEADEIIELPSEIVDVFGLLQQAPESKEIDELKQLLLKNYQLYQNDKEFKYRDLNISEELTIDRMFDITSGKIDYKTAINLYQKAFFLAKSRLRIENSINILKEIINNPKYDKTIEYLEQRGFGIEPEITTRASSDLFKLSESVSLNIDESERPLIDFINGLNDEQLIYILNNPSESVKGLLNQFIDNDYNIEREEWFANSIIDNFDFESLGVREKLSESQRQDIIIALKENNFLESYYYLKQQGVKEKDISRVLFNNLIKGKNTIDLKETFTLEQLEWFIGYNRVKGLGLNLRSYQRTAVRNVKEKFNSKQFTSVILPTGAGKSYVALEQLYEHKNEKMLYVAPNVEILNQLKNIIKKTYNPEEHLGEDIDTVISRLFPNLSLTTYQNLKDRNDNTLKAEFNTNYSLIVFDELHRTGATEWMAQINELLDNQGTDTKILGITATPERDMDLKNMSDYWAQRYGYTDEEILKGEHLAYNIDIIDAIKLGIIANPKVINCTYSLISDGSINDLKTTIEDITDDNIKAQKLAEYKELRKNIENSNGIEQILHDNIKESGKYIVFLPVTQKNKEVYEDLDGNEIAKSKAEEIIEKYQLLMRQYLFSYDYLNTNNKVKKLYLKIKDDNDLTEEEKSYLELEKQKILLLTKIDIPGKSNALNTDTNIIADTIIKYMNWENIEYKNKLYWLRNLTREKVEDYSMLGSYSDRKNKKQLDSFNDKTDNKTKFMFVMNKLNEGVHVDDITGIVWLRPLDTNSRILYLQQLGRCIKSLTPGKELTEDDIPLVIDLVNNTLKVKLDKGMSPYERDLQKLKYIEEWIEINDRYPTFESDNEEETTYINTLIDIKSKYEQYLYNDLLKAQDVRNRLLIEEILEVGSNIDLWSQNLPEKQHNKKTKGTSTGFDLLFEINALSRNFVELKNEVEEIDNARLNVIQWVKKIEDYCRHNTEWPKRGDIKKTTSDGTMTSVQLYNWLSRSGYTSGNFKFTDIKDETGRSLKEILDELREQYVKNRHIIEMVKKIEDYCRHNTEWPKVGDTKKTTSDGTTTSSQLYYWLSDSGYRSGNFEYADIKDETGRSLKEILDELRDQYGKINPRSDEYKIKMVKRIEDYYRHNTEWPKAGDTKKTTSDGTTTSSQLYYWLLKSGYTSGNFKFADIKDETGRSLKEILDELREQYEKNNTQSDEYKIEMVKKISDYCRHNTEWPKVGDTKKTTSDGSTTSSQLYNWLLKSGYTSGNFKFADIKDETGRSLKEILDELRELVKNRHIIEMVKKIEDYCRYNTEWPKDKNTEKTTSDGTTTSVQLYNWLANSGYRSGNFKFADIKDETGRNLKEILDELREQYVKNRHIIEMVKKIEDYCRHNKEWPKAGDTEKTTSDGSTTSSQLYNWLFKSEYTSGNFKYADIEDETGRSLKEILDELRELVKNQHIIEMVKKIEDYCRHNIEWPKVRDTKKTTSDGTTTSSQLYSWLANSGYISGNFEYADIKDETGRSLKEILDELREQFKKQNKKKYDQAKEEFDDNSKFNEVVEKRKNNERKLS